MKEQLRRDIGKRMRKVRKSMGFTQDKMASFFDVGRANYSRIEKGEIFPNPNVLNILRTQFNISLDWLITDQGKMANVDKVDNSSVLEFGEHTEEIKDLLYHMGRIPMVRHTVLGFYFDYKEKNKKIIKEFLEELGQEKKLAVR
jgi:transcriptional regulator with XRE-family HTH domain